MTGATVQFAVHVVGYLQEVGLVPKQQAPVALHVRFQAGRVDRTASAVIFGSILTPNGEAPMQDQTPLLCNPRDFVLDLLNFVAEQIELAKANPADQLAAIDAASGVIPALKSRLDDDLKSTFGIVLQNRLIAHGEKSGMGLQ